MSRLSMLDPTLLPAHRLVREIASGRLSPIDLVERFLNRIRTWDANLHALTEVYAADARAAAAAAHRSVQTGEASGALLGLPLVAKDLVEIAGKITSGGSKGWATRRSAVTAGVIDRLTRQGAIILGKTHTVEFALGAWGINQHLGTPRNPWDLCEHRAPGGSSSGSAVAVAAHLAACAIGTDTGGSIRLPAAWCGIVGVKPTKGRVSTLGILPLSPTLDTVGPMTRSVEDAALLLRAMQGPDPGEWGGEDDGLDDPLVGLHDGVAGLRLARLPAAALRDTAPDVTEAYEASIEVLARQGAAITTAVLPRAFDDYRPLGTIVMAEAHRLYGELARAPTLPLDDAVRRHLLNAARISTAEYEAALRRRTELTREFAAVFDAADALLLPTTQTAAPPLRRIDRAKPPTRYTRFVNFLDLCAVALPNGVSADGMPISLQIVCPGFHEALALRVGWACENATEWHTQSPPLAQHE